MNILYISPTHPEQQFCGGAQRTHLLWKALMQFGTVYTVVHSGEQIHRISKYMVHRRVEWPQNTYRKIINKIFIWLGTHTGFYIIPFSLFPNLESLFPGIKFDMVVVRYYTLLRLCYPWKIAPFFLDIDDHPLTCFDTVVAPSKKYNFFTRTLWRFVLKLKLYWAARHLAGTWVANQDDLKKVGTAKKTVLLNNVSINAADSNLQKDQERKILFTVGSLAFGPNINGIYTFLDQVWNRIHFQFPQLEYWIVGRGGYEKDIKCWSSYPGVRFIGEVDDIGKFYEKALASVVPVEQGAGTCIKTLESLEHFRVCLSTPFGARGLVDNGKKPEENGVLIYHNANEFACYLQELLNNPERRKDKEYSAKAYVNKFYSKAQFVRQIFALLEK